MRYALNEAALNAYLTHAGFGGSTLELVASGGGSRATLGSGSTLMELQGSANGYHATTGSGRTTLEMTAQQGFPDQVPVPTAWSYTHPSRRTVVAPQPGETTIQTSRRTTVVPRQDRTTLVPPERMQ